MKEIFRINDNIFYHTKWKDKSESQKFRHSIILPRNTYSPWEEEIDFIEAYNSAKDHTLLDKFRCFELWEIAKQYSAKEGDIIEVGVWRGGSSLIMAKACKEKGKMYLCDTFSGVVKAGEEDSFYKGGEHADTSVEIVTKLFNSNGISNYKICKGIFPEDTSDEIDSDKIKICHIDVDVYQSAKDIFNWVYPRLLSGGIIIFDDYGFAACEGITTLVHELLEKYQDLIKIYNINGHGLLIKR
ncbi:MAG: hypothetical protein RLZ10_2684 [Bacteroidota bacterium]|jgi:O-methyltransferase